MRFEINIGFVDYTNAWYNSQVAKPEPYIDRTRYGLCISFIVQTIKIALVRCVRGL